MIKCDIAKNMRKVGVSITSEKLTLRENGIESYLGNDPSSEALIGLLKLYYTGECDKEFFEEFVNAFREVDNTFSDDLTNEIQILAGLTIYEMIFQNEWEDIIAEVEIYASIYNFLGYKSICEDVYNTMMKDFDDRRINIREGISFEETRVSALGKNVNFASAEDEVVYDEKVAESLNGLVKKVNEIVKSLNALRKEDMSTMAILYEDSQMLWWLLTGISDDLEEMYSKLDCKTAAILMGTDLAKRVSNFPGPYAVKRLLSKMLDFECEKDRFSFDDYIEAIDDDFINKYIGQKAVDTPVLYALKKKAENGAGCWTGAFAKKFEKKSEYTLLEMAYETYLECLILQKMQE